MNIEMRMKIEYLMNMKMNIINEDEDEGYKIRFIIIPMHSNIILNE